MTNSKKVNGTEKEKDSTINSYNAFLRRFYPDAEKLEKVYQNDRKTSRSNSLSLERGAVPEPVRR